MNDIKKNRLVISFMLIFLITMSQYSFAAPTVSIISPSNGGYFLQNQGGLYVRAYVSGNPTSVELYYSSRLSANNNTYVDYHVGSLTREGSTSYYSKTFSLNGWYKFPRLYFPLHVTTPVLKVVAIDQTGTGVNTKDGTICKEYQLTYANMDNTFYYNSVTSNSFRAPSSGHPNVDGVHWSWTYNCMADALNRSVYGWMWPWSGYPSDSQLVNEMASYGYNTRSKTMFSGAEVVYYTGGHFSRVIAWNHNGMPTRIVSKWGGLEALESNSANPFVNGIYGNAYYYFRKS